MRKTILWVLFTFLSMLFILALGSAASFYAAGSADVIFNHLRLVDEVKPIRLQDEILVPLEEAAALLDVAVTLGEKIGTASFSYYGRVFNVTVGQSKAFVQSASRDEEPEPIALNTPAGLVRGRIFVPVSFLSGCFGLEAVENGNPDRIELLNGFYRFDPRAQTAEELEAYLNDSVSAMHTVYGTYSFEGDIRVFENEDPAECYDIAVAIDWYSINPWYQGFIGNPDVPEEEQAQLIQDIRDYQEELARAVFEVMPGKKVRGGFIAYDDTYDIDQTPQYEDVRFGWKNYIYTVENFPYYEDSYLYGFHWHEFDFETEPADALGRDRMEAVLWPQY